MSAVDAAVAESLAALTATYGFALASDKPLLAIAFSGGLDSTVLLDAFARALAPSQLVALHVHHGLSRDADDWLHHTEQESQRRGVASLAQRVDLSQLSGQGVEAAARVARYRALTDMAEQAGARVLLIAQHADDQAETVLLQLLRGAGLPGVAAMPRERFADTVPVPDANTCARSHAHTHANPCANLHANDVANTGVPASSDRHATAIPGGEGHATTSLRLYRPFLHLTRAHLELYAARHGLNWINDESNQDVRFARNALRRDVLPQIDSYFPAYRETLARFARHAATAQSLCDDLAALDWQQCVMVPASSEGQALTPRTAAASVLSRDRLQTLSSDRLSNLLRYWIKQQAMPAASAGRLNEMVRQLLETSSSNVATVLAMAGAPLRSHGRVSIAHAGRVLHAYRDSVFWSDVNRVAVTNDGVPTPGESVHAATSYPGGAVWPLPLWRGELRVLEASHQKLSSHRDAQAITTAFQTTEAPSEAPPNNDLIAVRLPHDWQHYGNLSARPRAGGERLRLAADRPARSLKQHFQQAAVPVWLRDVPLFYIGEQLIFVPHIGGHWPFTGEAKATSDDAGSEAIGHDVLLYWHPWGHSTQGDSDLRR